MAFLYQQQVEALNNGMEHFIILTGNCNEILDQLPDESINCVITSPPYWQMRAYHVKEEHSDLLIGTERKPEEYVKNLTLIFNKTILRTKLSGNIAIIDEILVFV